MSTRTQRLCVYAGLGMLPFFFLGFWVLAGFVPPPSPNDTPRQIAAVYAGNRTGIRVGMFIATFAGALLCFLVAAIGTQLRRIEEGRHTVLAFVQMIAGACTVVEFLFPPLVWQTAAFRPDRLATTVQTLNDLAWLPFLGITGTLIIQQVVIAAAILKDPRPQPVMPRWVAYANLWTALGIMPASFVVFFHSGPLAWNGVLAWWLVLVDFFVWLVLMGYALLVAIKHQETEEAAPSRGTSLSRR